MVVSSGMALCLLVMGGASVQADDHETELARMVGMSAEGFLRWFRERTSTTPHAYLVRRRLREASRRLLYTDETIDAIAVGVGFPNRHYFSRVFAAQIGDPPARFRRRGAAVGSGPE